MSLLWDFPSTVFYRGAYDYFFAEGLSLRDLQRGLLPAQLFRSPCTCVCARPERPGERGRGKGDFRALLSRPPGPVLACLGLTLLRRELIVRSDLLVFLAWPFLLETKGVIFVSQCWIYLEPPRRVPSDLQSQLTSPIFRVFPALTNVN